MKHILITTIAAVLLVGCGEAQESPPPAETQPAEPVAEVPAQPSSPPPTTKAPDISIHKAAKDGNINPAGSSDVPFLTELNGCP